MAAPSASEASEMEAKLQALFQTMVAEHVVETTNNTTVVVATDSNITDNIETIINDAAAEAIAGEQHQDGGEEVVINENGGIVRFASQALSPSEEDGAEDNQDGGETMVHEELGVVVVGEGGQINITTQQQQVDVNGDTGDIVKYQHGDVGDQATQGIFENMFVELPFTLSGVSTRRF